MTDAVVVGAQWVGPDHHRMRALVDELAVETLPLHDAGAAQLRLAGRRVVLVGVARPSGRVAERGRDSRREAGDLLDATTWT